jgi:hypothetical protein
MCRLVRCGKSLSINVLIVVDEYAGSSDGVMDAHSRNATLIKTPSEDVIAERSQNAEYIKTYLIAFRANSSPQGIGGVSALFLIKITL